MSLILIIINDAGNCENDTEGHVIVIGEKYQSQRTSCAPETYRQGHFGLIHGIIYGEDAEMENARRNDSLHSETNSRLSGRRIVEHSSIVA